MCFIIILLIQVYLLTFFTASCETLRKELAVWNAKREEETFRIAELEQETEV